MSDKPTDQPQGEAAGADEQVKVTGPQFPSRGAQVILTGEAQAAARGGMGGDIEQNTAVKRALEADGTVADGSTPDGSTRTGRPAPDVVVTQEAKASGETPAEEGTTRVEVQDPADVAPPPPPPPADDNDDGDDGDKPASRRRRS